MKNHSVLRALKNRQSLVRSDFAVSAKTSIKLGVTEIISIWRLTKNGLSTSSHWFFSETKWFCKYLHILFTE